MLRLSNPYSVPGRYFFDINERRLNHADARTLYHLCVEQGEERSYKEWHAVMIHHLCLELPPGSCLGETDGDKYVKRLTWKDINGFVMAVSAVAGAALSGEPVYVNQIEADRRAFICKNCSHNTLVSCAGCNGIIMLANIFLRGRLCKDQTSLGACNLCGCWLAAKVWCSDEVLKRVVKVEEYPANCWNHKEKV